MFNNAFDYMSVKLLTFTIALVTATVISMNVNFTLAQ